MSAGCTKDCQHIGPDGGWDHEARLEEDRGEIHTDDCGFFHCRHDHDPGECCTAGQPGVVCRVPRQSPPGGTPNRPPDLNDPAAEAAQSPQVGAAGGPPCYCCNGTGSVPHHGAPSARALEESLFLISQWTLRHEALRMAAEKVRKVFRGGPTVRSYTGEEGAALAELEDLLASIARNEFYDTDHHERVLAIAAEPGRSTSDRPPDPSPVASADPELAALLREARPFVEAAANALDPFGPREVERRKSARNLLARIDAALSRLTGQSATANESGGAARGLPEEER
jgi:hypothetical protein